MNINLPFFSEVLSVQVQITLMKVDTECIDQTPIHLTFPTISLFIIHSDFHIIERSKVFNWAIGHQLVTINNLNNLNLSETETANNTS